MIQKTGNVMNELAEFVLLVLIGCAIPSAFWTATLLSTKADTTHDLRFRLATDAKRSGVWVLAVCFCVFVVYTACVGLVEVVRYVRENWAPVGAQIISAWVFLAWFAHSASRSERGTARSENDNDNGDNDR